MAELVRSAVTGVASLLGLGEAMDNMDVTPDQSEPLRDDQVQNNAGGFGWKVSDRDRLRRFLILGSEGGTYYVKEQELGKQNAQCIQRMIKNGHGDQVVEDLVKYSLEGRAAKQEPILFTLALCARDENAKTKKLAYEALGKVCRIPTHLFSFVEYSQTLSSGKGWGRAHRRAIETWYKSRKPKSLAMAVTKYAQRNGWTHRDLARLSHLQPHTKAHALIYCYMVRGHDEAVKLNAHLLAPPAAAVGDNSAAATAMDVTPAEDVSTSPTDGESAATADSASATADKEMKKTKAKKPPKEFKLPEVEDNMEETAAVFAFLEGVEQMKKASSEQEVVSLIAQHGLVREHVPSEYLNSRLVWEALLKDMPMTAMLRNLAKMTTIELLKPLGDHTHTVCQRLRDADALHRARVHPYDVLLAMKTYMSGRGLRGKLSWTPVPEIESALNDAFYAAFRAVQPTGKRYLLALDVSGSMWGSMIMNSNIDAATASACMAMVTARTEKRHHVVGFSDKLVDVKISPQMRLEEVMEVMNRIPMGGTDCAQPMLYAAKKKLEVDVFIVYTDCETWAGRVHPSEALKRYRRQMNMPDAKLIVVGMTANGFTIADPEDRCMLDMVGFDAAGPGIIREFSLGEI